LTNQRDRVAGNMVAIPLLGQIAAGIPVHSEENHEDILTVDSRMLGTGGTVFALRVKGDSMHDSGIFDRDIVFVRQQNHAENGEIVAVLVDDEATVKQYFREKGHIRLQPANDKYDPIIVKPRSGEVTILGKVVGLTRSY